MEKNELAGRIKEFLAHCESIHRSKATVSGYQIDLKKFAAFVKDIKLTQINITRQVLQQYINQLSEVQQPRSVRRKLAALQSFYRFLGIALPKVDVPDIPKRLPKAISEEDMEKIIQRTVADKTLKGCRDLAIIETLYCGPRNSELRQITPASINHYTKSFACIGKGNTEITYYLSDQAIKAIKAYINRLGCYQAVEKTRKLFDVTSKGLGDIIRERTKFLKKHITPHSFRHTFAVDMLGKTDDIRLVQALMNHKSIGSTMIYTEVADNKKMAALRQHPRSV